MYVFVFTFTEIIKMFILFKKNNIQWLIFLLPVDSILVLPNVIKELQKSVIDQSPTRFINLFHQRTWRRLFPQIMLKLLIFDIIKSIMKSCLVRSALRLLKFQAADFYFHFTLSQSLCFSFYVFRFYQAYALLLNLFFHMYRT